LAIDDHGAAYLIEEMPISRDVTIHGLPDPLPVKNHGEGLVLVVHKYCLVKGEGRKIRLE